MLDSYVVMPGGITTYESRMQSTCLFIQFDVHGPSRYTDNTPDGHSFSHPVQSLKKFPKRR